VSKRQTVLLPVKRVAHRVIHSRIGLETGAAHRLAAFRTRRSPPAVFIWVPKSAGTSLWRLLASNGGIQYFDDEQARLAFPNAGIATFGHMSYAALRSDGVISDEFDDAAFRFTVVRNPFDRMVSLYLHLQRVGRIPAAMRFEMFTELIREGNVEPVNRANGSGLSQCNPQVAWFSHDPDLSSTHVGRFEELDAFVDVLRDRLGIAGSLPKVNVSRDRTDYRPYFSSHISRQNVEEHYAADFEAFDYDF
jgi:hypothetical protein